MSEVVELIKKRRSIRRYTDEEVSEREIRLLLEAAMAAPSADNLRPWHFVVVQEVGLRQRLSQVHRWAGMAAQAPVVFVVLGDEALSSQWKEDCSAATENLLIAAAGLELGAVWVGLGGGAEAEVRKIVNAPSGLRALCLVPVGRPAEKKPPRTQYEEARVHRERFR